MCSVYVLPESVQINQHLAIQAVTCQWLCGHCYGYIQYHYVFYPLWKVTLKSTIQVESETITHLPLIRVKVELRIFRHG